MTHCSYLFTGSVSAMRSLPHLHIPGAHSKDEDVCMRSSTARGSLSHKPPLSPFCPVNNPIVSSFSASCNNFAADRVQSSPSVMQTEHAESAPAQPRSSSAETEMILSDDEAFREMPGAVHLKPSRLSSETKLNDMVALEGGIEPQLRLPSPSSDLVENSSQGCGEGHAKSQIGQHLLPHRGSQMSSASLSMRREVMSPDMMIIEEEGFVNGTVQEASAAAAALSCLSVSSSPCCTFQLPTALSHGIAESPAPGNIGSESSARRKSFSPLETGPVSILPMVENPETGLPSISCDTLVQLLTGHHNAQVATVKIVDCRCGLSLHHDIACSL